MTEDQWLACVGPEAMLNHLTDRVSPRKLRLYAIGCCRRIWSLFGDPRCKHAVEVAQRYADNRATDAELAAAGQVVAGVARVWGNVGATDARATYAIGGAAWAATRPSAWLSAWDAGWDARMAARDFIPGTRWEAERSWQAGLLADLFGNPFRPWSFEPTWRYRNENAALTLARVIYDEDRFGDLPYLADALEDAGCDDRHVLDHCRERRPHYRGCWVVDAVLGYE